MCVIFLAWQSHPRWRLAVAANRDEFHERPTLQAGVWGDDPRVLGGRDLRSGGTWMAVSREGRFAAVTNFREAGSLDHHRLPSRGELVIGFLQSDLETPVWLEQLRRQAGQFAGFSLFVCDGESLGFFSNRTEHPTILSPGIYGLSNHLIDTPWPKVEKGKRLVESALQQSEDPVEPLLALLSDRSEANPEEIPATGLEPEEERRLSALFVQGEEYGTRSSTVMLDDGEEIRYVERTFSPDAHTLQTRDTVLERSRPASRPMERG